MAILPRTCDYSNNGETKITNNATIGERTKPIFNTTNTYFKDRIPNFSQINAVTGHVTVRSDRAFEHKTWVTQGSSTIIDNYTWDNKNDQQISFKSDNSLHNSFQSKTKNVGIIDSDIIIHTVANGSLSGGIPRNYWFKNVYINISYTPANFIINAQSSNNNYGTVNLDLKGQEPIAGNSFTITAESKPGYHLKSWDDDNENTNDVRQIVLTEDMSTAFETNLQYTAIFAPNIYTVTLNNQLANLEQEGTETIYLKYGINWYSDQTTNNIITKIITPQKTGYFFGGYYTATNGEGSQIIDNLGNINNGYLTFTTNDISLYAYWIPIEYYLVYDDGSGNQSSPISLAYDKKYKIEHFDAIFSEENYPTWNLIYKDNGATEDFIDNEPIKRTWNDRWRNEVTMKDYGLNEEVSGLSSADGDKVILKARWKAEAKKTNLSIPIRKYHQFAGWKDSSGNTYDQGDTFKFIENNSVLTAQWEKIQPRMFAGIDNIQKLFLSKDKEIKKIFVYITPENNGSGTHIEV